MKKILILVLSAGCYVSCSYFEKKIEENVVARVGDNFLYEEEIQKLISEDVNEEDSINIVTNYINTWAKKQLLVEKARINLDERQIAEFEDLVNQYRADLLIATYKEALVATTMDTVIATSEINSYYEDNKENFKLNEPLYKMRYIHLDKSYDELDTARELLKRYNQEDQEKLEEMSLQFKASSFNDSTWIKVSQLVQKIPLISFDNTDDYLKKSQFFELTDSLEVYLVHIKDVLKRNDIAPESYVNPTLRQIILNKRKLEFIRNLEKELMDEAVQKKQYEIYENRN
ncbi:peptidyl-prolyl cis-trans isomerase [Ascidiimonas sp. W6]|uniref:peptidyl-prolyl cis-trans isomerase n=1 Tax=Ascidiimonas meishanensis TaxID=3128903 RepID=UPI0030EBB49A